MTVLRDYAAAVTTGTTSTTGTTRSTGTTSSTGITPRAGTAVGDRQRKPAMADGDEGT